MIISGGHTKGHFLWKEVVTDDGYLYHLLIIHKEKLLMVMSHHIGVPTVSQAFRQAPHKCAPFNLHQNAKSGHHSCQADMNRMEHLRQVHKPKFCY